jgi:hypothetical protein
MSRAVISMWLTWVVAMGLGATWILRSYLNSPGPNFRKIALILLPVMVLGSCTYAWLRRPFLWQYEPPALAAVAAAALLYYEPRAFLVCLALFLASYCLGALTQVPLHMEPVGPVDRIVIRCGLGCGLLIPALFVIGELGLYYPAVFAAVLLLPIAIGFRNAIAAVEDLREMARTWKSSIRLRHPLVGIPIAFGAIAMLCSLMVLLAPSINFDTLQMHFPSVEHYAASHSIAAIPEIDYSYFPQGCEVLWTLAYGLAGTAGVQMEAGFFFLLFLFVLSGPGAIRVRAMAREQEFSVDCGRSLFSGADNWDQTRRRLRRNSAGPVFCLWGVETA